MNSDVEDTGRTGETSRQEKSRVTMAPPNSSGLTQDSTLIAPSSNEHLTKRELITFQSSSISDRQEYQNRYLIPLPFSRASFG